ncbi:MAG: DNA translocase FtsK [Ruminococcaceae bacterium]|nr:DNA translocase FtsK [Oscillospiraceae bacterium]
MFTVSVFLLLAAIIPGEAGWAAIHNFILGVFGFFGYAVPLLFGTVAVLLALDKLKGKPLVKVVGVSVILVLSSAFVNILFTSPESANFGDCIKRAYLAGGKGSGFFGAVFGYPLYAAFKNPGAWIICALLIFATVMILSGTTLISLYKAISKPVKKTYEAVESVYNENLERKRSAAEIDIPLDDDIPADHKKTTTIEEKQKSVVKKYRDLDKEEMEDISSDSTGENAARAAAQAAVSKTAAAISERADSEFDEANEGNVNDIINKVNAEADSKEGLSEKETKKLELELSEGSAITIESQAAEYKYPPISLLAEPAVESTKSITAELEQTATLLVDTLRSFGVESRIINISRGPSVTRYELQPAAGVKISKITNLADDIALNLATAGVRIEAPIPNKPAVGIEVPNKNNSVVKIREIIDSQAFSNSKSKISMALGKDISGEQRVTDIAKMPHGLIAGATGSGKSVCINSMIMSILYKATPDEVKLLLIDPKVVELSIYNGIPHLIVPVVTDPRKAAGALGWAVMEMERRYKLFDEYKVRNLSGYNEQAAKRDDMMKLPHIVIVIDELADLMMTSPREVEDSICRIAQKARAAGMHMIVATQRPSVDVVTGLIKANIPTRIAFAVSSQVDSKTIIDIGGAEKLMGKGDMLFFPTGAIKPERIQGCFVSDAEVEKVVNYLKSDHRNEYDEDVMNEIERQAAKEKAAKSGMPEDAVEDDGDSMLEAAIECVVDAGQASTSLLQRKLRLGYARAARIIDQMEERGIVGPYEGSKPRQVLISKERLLEMKAGQSDSE